MIDEKDIDRLKEIFVPRQECQEINDEIKANLTKDLVRLAVIENQLKVITWILYAVAGGIITVIATPKGKICLPSPFPCLKFGGET